MSHSTTARVWIRSEVSRMLLRLALQVLLLHSILHIVRWINVMLDYSSWKFCNSRPLFELRSIWWKENRINDKKNIKMHFNQLCASCLREKHSEEGIIKQRLVTWQQKSVREIKIKANDGRENASKWARVVIAALAGWLNEHVLFTRKS